MIGNNNVIFYHNANTSMIVDEIVTWCADQGLQCHVSWAGGPRATAFLSFDFFLVIAEDPELSEVHLMGDTAVVKFQMHIDLSAAGWMFKSTCGANKDAQGWVISERTALKGVLHIMDDMEQQILTKGRLSNVSPPSSIRPEAHFRWSHNMQLPDSAAVFPVPHQADDGTVCGPPVHKQPRFPEHIEYQDLTKSP